jgi:hypothetical protein
MASAFPGSPRVLKGALVVFETPAPVPTNIIAFQFNPDQVSRTFSQQLGDQDPWRSSGDTMFVLPPTETLSMSVELDAADQLETGDALATAVGLHPTLAALELLLYPSSIDLILDKALALAGTARVKPARVPIVLLVWGPRLNPIRAKADLTLRTLTEKELSVAGPPFDALAFVNLIAKEVIARGAGAAAIADVAGSASFSFF